jgi:TolA-binding protein
MILDDHISALRATGDDGDPTLAQATRVRLRRSLERDHGTRRQLLSAAVGVLFAATASWALATGQLQKLWRRAEHDVTPARILPHAAAPRPAPSQQLVVMSPPPPVAEPTQPLAPKPVHRAIAKPAAPIEVLYRKAHELHFHGDDYAAALAAWDDYLATEPSGRFAIEARYNRALCLVRLGRLAEARDALDPFARGEVQPAGYRRDEAKALVDKIASGLNGTP